MTDPVQNNLMSSNLVLSGGVRSSGHDRTARAGNDVRRNRSQKKRTRRTEDTPFSVKVTRRWTQTGREILWRLGLYSEVETMPLGLVVDAWA
jgi:hypothetical protein